MKKAMRQSTLTRILGIGSVILLVFTFFSFMICNIYNSSLGAALTQKNDLIFYANQLKNASGYLTREVRAYAATGDIRYYNNYWDEVNTLKNRDKAIESMNKIGLTAEEKEIISNISNISNSLIPIEEQAMAEAKNNNLTNALSILYGKTYTPGIEEILDLTEKFIITLDNRVNSRIKKLDSIVGMIELSCTILLSTVVIFQSVLVIFIAKKFIKPIISVQNEMLQISKGNLSSKFDIESNTSEIGMLADSIHKTKKFLKTMIGDISLSLSKMSEGNFDFNITREYIGEFVEIKISLDSIIHDLNKTFKTINTASNQVAGEAEELSMIAHTLSSGATEQASTIEEISASITEVSEQLNKNATKAKTGSENSDEAGFKILESNNYMSTMISAINEISQSSQKISDIIKTIEDIAFQTNILALNAAIEAARAGEAGKSFVVVAEKVRTLAAKSTDAVKNTSDLIKDIVNSIDNGIETAEFTANSLKEVMNSAKYVTDMMQEISKSSVEQANTISQIALGIEQVSLVVQNNSLISQKSEGESQSLNGQAQTLKQLTEQFKFKK